MNKISFPGLNLKFEISPIAFSVNNIDIYWYAIFMVFAFIVALIIFKINNRQI
ncbi:MAG: hypothetical protein Q4G09_06970 [Clostridia bacterium]|nr:hypothetical protein [Clostridia bacterium]